MNAWIVIAAYKETHSIGHVVKELVKAGYRNVVVVDDGSPDDTYSVAKQHTRHVLKHVINRGQGAALKTGIDYALLQGADVVVTFDADGQHRVEDLPAMIAPVKSGEVDVALGSRFLSRGTNVPFFRKLVLKAGIVIVWLFYGIRLTDVHNGFRALSRHAAEQIEITMDRMEHASEILSEIKRRKLKYVEVPVVIRYTEYSKAHGQSSLNAVRIFYKMLMHKLSK
jgi:glycosyltransferase involved in cell wall biosynthesis